jgi:hypothetical protein
MASAVCAVAFSVAYYRDSILAPLEGWKNKDSLLKSWARYTIFSLLDAGAYRRCEFFASSDYSLSLAAPASDMQILTACE